MSHKGLVAVIILASVVTIGVYASTIIPPNYFINSIQQDIVLETIQTTDEVLLKKTVVLDSTMGVTDSMQTENRTGRDLRVVINDSMSSTTIP